MEIEAAGLVWESEVRWGKGCLQVEPCGMSVVFKVSKCYFRSYGTDFDINSKTIGRVKGVARTIAIVVERTIAYRRSIILRLLPTALGRERRNCRHTA